MKLEDSSLPMAQVLTLQAVPMHLPTPLFETIITNPIEIFYIENISWSYFPKTTL
jgi:hypothetical protein